jgi:lysophospholipase L1-like esterase
VVLGDSSAAGVGATATASTVGGRLAEALAADGARVSLSSTARYGARAADLAGQVDSVRPGPGLAVVLVGANDVNHGTGLGAVRRDLAAAVRRLTGAGLRVVVGTCPDLGGARAYPQPLRDLVAWRGRAVARAERRAVLEAGGAPVDLARLTGPAFRADPRTLSADRFHPSDRGYALWAAALAPAVRDALPAGRGRAGRVTSG